MSKFSGNKFINEKGLVVSKRISFTDGNLFITVICALALIMTTFTFFKAPEDWPLPTFPLFWSAIFVLFLQSLGTIKQESFYERVNVEESFAFVSESSYYLNSRLPEGAKVSDSKLSKIKFNSLTNGQYTIVSDDDDLVDGSLIVIKELGFAAALAVVDSDLRSAREVDYVVSYFNSHGPSSFSAPSDSLRVYDLSKFTCVNV